MEFNQKLQDLRKRKGLTQEQLAESLYVSRTAISKWESGRGYPNIDSLKLIAKFFAVTVDELLSTDEMLIIAEADNKQNKSHFRDLTYGLLDLSIVMLLFLPFFAVRVGEVIENLSLIALDGISGYLKVLYFVVVILSIIMGISTLTLQNCQRALWLKIKTTASLLIGAISVVLFVISRQPYAGVFAFSLLIIKTIVLIKGK